jgi:hypothetical protein
VSKVYRLEARVKHMPKLVVKFNSPDYARIAFDIVAHNNLGEDRKNIPVHSVDVDVADGVETMMIKMSVDDVPYSKLVILTVSASLEEGEEL